MSMIAKGGAEWVERPRDLSPSECATLLHAAELLERSAEYLRDRATNVLGLRKWTDDMIATAKALREMAGE